MGFYLNKIIDIDSNEMFTVPYLIRKYSRKLWKEDRNKKVLDSTFNIKIP